MHDIFTLINQLCKEKGVKYSEVRLTDLNSMELTFDQGRKEWIQTSHFIELQLSIWIDEYFGHSHTTSVCEQSLNRLVENAVESLQAFKQVNDVILPDRILGFISNKGTAHLSEGNDSEVLEKEKIHLVKKFDSAIKGVSPKIQTAFRYQDREGILYLGNSDGTLISNKISEFFLDYSMKYEFALKKLHRSFTLAGALNHSNFTPKLAKTIGKAKALRFLNSAVVTLPPKKRMPVIMDGNLTGSIIHELIHGLDGDFALSGSPWRKKHKKRIFSKSLTIHDVPNYSDSRLIKFAHDAEGFPSKKSTVIENGVLTSFITDSNSAQRLKVTNSYNARLSLNNQYLFPASTNLVVEPGKVSLEEMLTKIQQGVLCQGALEVSVDWQNNMIRILPEQSLLFADGNLHRDLPLSVVITSPIEDFTTGLKYLGKKSFISNIYCTKGGGIICGVVSPTMLFDRFQVQER
ncbi:hypothetical protein CEE45_08210 [Candidatus Heimdallarchaeota archaeon B3_Heim]|nr:MAG: hypothetical protein CEE45_08210 [Candidatus Heimdallarchaeota archaeon B3_Heim]